MKERSSIDPILEGNLTLVRETIESACNAVGRDARQVMLQAVTKTVEPQRINQAIALGVRCIGENRVQEFLEKKPYLMLDGVEAHLIGHLQTNKVKQIVGEVSMIQSVDSVKVAKAISDRSLQAGVTTPVLVEVNMENEASKSGVAADELERLLMEIHNFSGIHVRGLMTVPPILRTEYEKRHVFSKMFQLFVDIGAKKLDNIDMLELSMGMSGDYREAVMEGATIVRVGSAIFGRRQY